MSRRLLVAAVVGGAVLAASPAGAATVSPNVAAAMKVRTPHIVSTCHGWQDRQNWPSLHAFWFTRGYCTGRTDLAGAYRGDEAYGVEARVTAATTACIDRGHSLRLCFATFRPGTVR